MLPVRSGIGSYSWSAAIATMRSKLICLCTTLKPPSKLPSEVPPEVEAVVLSGKRRLGALEPREAGHKEKEKGKEET